MPSITDIPRNDLEAVRRYYESRGRKISPEEWGVLASLQDDAAQFEDMSKNWNVEAESTSLLDAFNR